MKATIFSTIKYLLFLGIGVALLFLAFRGVNLKSTIHEISNANPFWIGVSVVLAIIAFVSRAYRWNILIEPLGYKPKLSNTTYALMVGYFANLALPRLGEVTRCGSLNKAENVPFDVLLGTVIVDRVLDVICLLICILITAIVEYERLGNFLYVNLFEPLKGKLKNFIDSPVLIGGAVVLAVAFFFLVRAVRQNTGKHGFISKIVALLKGILEGLKSVRKIKRPWTFLFHTVLIWTLYFLVTYVCFFALPATSQLDWKAGMFVLVVGGMSMSAPVQGGIGIFHLLVSQGLMLYEISHEHGIAFATLIHSTQTIVVILFGSISFVMLFLANRKTTNANT